MTRQNRRAIKIFFAAALVPISILSLIAACSEFDLHNAEIDDLAIDTNVQVGEAEAQFSDETEGSYPGTPTDAAVAPINESDKKNIDAGVATSDARLKSDATSKRADAQTPAASKDSGASSSSICPHNLYETQLLNLVNNERADWWRSPLVCSPEAAKVARNFAAKMCGEQFFGHTAPDGTTFAMRLKAAAIAYSAAGENIAHGQKTPAEVMDDWIYNSSNLSNILYAKFTHLGAGYVDCTANGPFWVLVFYTPATIAQ